MRRVIPFILCVFLLLPQPSLAVSVDKIYSSVCVVSDTKFKTSLREVIGFLSLVAAVFTGFGIGNPVPFHTEKNLGTGFQTKYGIITNSHVIEKLNKIKITPFKGWSRKFKPKRIDATQTPISITVLHTDEKVGKAIKVYDWGGTPDLALIRSNSLKGQLPLAETVSITEKVYALGHPKGKEFTPAWGTLRQATSTFLEIDFEGGMVAKGSSGSPVFNASGEVVGVIYAIGTSNNYAYAVSIDEIRRLFGLPDKEYNPMEAHPYTSTERGVLAEEVLNESLRQDFSLEPDDRIINITSAPFTSDTDSKEEFWSAWKRIDRNKTCRLLIRRGKNYYDVKFVPNPLTVIKKAPQVMTPWNGPVYCTQQSRLFHRPDCDELISGGDLIEFSSRESAIRASGTACSMCNP